MIPLSLSTCREQIQSYKCYDKCTQYKYFFSISVRKYPLKMNTICYASAVIISNEMRCQLRNSHLRSSMLKSQHSEYKDYLCYYYRSPNITKFNSTKFWSNFQLINSGMCIYPISLWNTNHKSKLPISHSTRPHFFQNGKFVLTPVTCRGTEVGHGPS